ncbi:MAG TPA: hypothetical protein VJU60_06030 [Thermoleophilaceae bacterium]|nr:hypothetical protein [Thermoleophilaceae bacterium]
MPERRKRKHRPAAPMPAGAPTAPPLTRRERTEAKNEAVRAALVPLAEGERPLWVTVAAVVAFLLPIANAIAYAAGGRGQATTLVFQAALMFSLAWGMWNVRYWAVLGMEAVLALLIVVLAILLLKASTALTVLIVVGLILAAGLLFWKLVREMARIQMPNEPR